MGISICFVNPTRRIQSGLQGLAKSMAARGHKVTILTPKRLEPAEVDALGVDQVMVYPSVFIPKIRYTLPLFFSQLRTLRRAVKSQEDPLICVYKYSYPTSWVPVFYARIARVPVLLITDSFPGISWRYGSRFVDFVGRVYSRSLGRMVLKLCDRVIVFGPALMKTARDLGLEEGKLLMIPKGVDLDQFRPGSDSQGVRASLGISPDEAMVLNVGRLAPVKGIDTLIEITRRLAHDGFRVRTVVVGDGPYRDEYERTAADIRQNITFTGFRTDIRELVSACDVFVLPSLSEGLPSALLEAAACGKASVASNTGAIPDVVIHGETGFLAEPQDAGSFVQHIESLLSDKHMAAELGRRACQHVMRGFDWEVVAGKYERLCEDVLEGRQKGK